MDVGSLLLPVVFLVVLYLLLIRPQQKRAREHRELVSGISIGDAVVTIGGIHGEVVELGESTMDLKLTEAAGDDVVVRFQRSALARVVRDTHDALDEVEDVVEEEPDEPDELEEREGS